MISLFCPLFHQLHLDGFQLLQTHCVENLTLNISPTVYFSSISIFLFILHFPSSFYSRRLETFLWALSLTSRAQLIQALSFLATKCQWVPLMSLLKVTTSVVSQGHLHWRCSECYWDSTIGKVLYTRPKDLIPGMSMVVENWLIRVKIPSPICFVSQPFINSLYLYLQFYLIQFPSDKNSGGYNSHWLNAALQLVESVSDRWNLMPGMSKVVDNYFW